VPKQRTKKPRKIRRKIKSNDLGLFILIGVIGIVVLWFLTKDPLPANSEVWQKNPSEEKEQKTKSKHKKAEKDKPAILQAQQETPKAVTQTTPEIPVNSMETAISNVIAKLGIPESYCRKHKASSQISYNIPIDRSCLDLTYANMIFKGEIEKYGGVFVNGKDSAGKQVLLFRSREKPLDYLITLYYDNKLYEKKTNLRTIAIVVDDFGSISGSLLEGFFKLDKNICFAIFPDEPYSVATMQKAKAQGRTTIIHVPMEPIGYPNVNPGKNAIFVQYNESKIDKLLDRFVRQLPDCSGINNHMGSLATTDEDVMKAVMNNLKKHGLFFLDSRTSNVSVGYSIAQKSHVNSYRNDMFLDSPNISQSTMDEKISQIIGLSATRNNVIVITHCHNNDKLVYLQRFISRIKAAGFTLVPITDIGKYDVPEIL